MSDKSKLLVDIGGVTLGRLPALLVVQLVVPLELQARQELLHLEADKHGQGDDVVVEDHPQQEHLQNPAKQLLQETILKEERAYLTNVTSSS